ncbi:hypothetical protein ACIRRA_39890 [Nocardia sp. NPDC101769]|uniref:hypothetical protein n=1 Tax=Nocardia sp. NPDC101769 TaxID=3364333 RepID=UPI00381BCFC6
MNTNPFDVDPTPDPAPAEPAQTAAAEATGQAANAPSANPFAAAQSTAAPAELAKPAPAPAPESAAEVQDETDDAPLWQIMPAVEGGGASTLDGWCACSAEIAHNPTWRPTPGRSPYLVLTAPKTEEGIKRARQLAGALTRTAGTAAHVAAIVVLAPAKANTSGGLALKELISAAEAAGVQIITTDHDPALADMPSPPEGIHAWTPHHATNPGVPRALSRVYTRLFFTIADRESAQPAQEA